MDADKAIEIVKSLADGVDPHTGERYPSDSPYQNADTVRALKAIRMVDAARIERTHQRPHRRLLPEDRVERHRNSQQRREPCYSVPAHCRAPLSTTPGQLST